MSTRPVLRRHPALVAAAVASALALLALNGAALAFGREAPGLLGAVMLADLAAVGVTILIAARQILRTRGEAEEASARARRELEESEMRLAAIIEAAMHAVLASDDAQRIVLFNRAAEEMFRCPRDKALGAPPERFIPQRLREAHRGHVARFARTGVSSRRMGQAPALWGLRADGEEFPIEASISQVVLQGRRHFTAIVRDITAQVQAGRPIEQRERERGSCVRSRRSSPRRARRKKAAPRARAARRTGPAPDRPQGGRRMDARAAAGGIGVGRTGAARGCAPRRVGERDPAHRLGTAPAPAR